MNSNDDRNDVWSAVFSAIATGEELQVEANRLKVALPERREEVRSLVESSSVDDAEARRRITDMRVWLELAERKIPSLVEQRLALERSISGLLGAPRREIEAEVAAEGDVAVEKIVQAIRPVIRPLLADADAADKLAAHVAAQLHFQSDRGAALREAGDKARQAADSTFGAAYALREALAMLLTYRRCFPALRRPVAALTELPS